MVKWQNEGQAVISVISTLSAKHWKEYVEEEWTELTQGITGEVRLMVLAGVHGGIGGEIGDAKNNIKDIQNQAVCNCCTNQFFRVEQTSSPLMCLYWVLSNSTV